MEIIHAEGITVPIGSHQGKTIILGSDHRGFYYKQKIAEYLKNKGYNIIDVGTFSREKCDYPIISDKIGQLISQSNFTCVGIGVCGSGIGILIPASKHKGVYVARCLNKAEAETSRKHNNTNFLGLGSDSISIEAAYEIIDAWLTTLFYTNPETDESYLRRFVQTVKLENQLSRNNSL
jgi:ribose 5-phosphate isomerase B